MVQAWELPPKKHSVTFSLNYTHSIGVQLLHINYPNNFVVVFKARNTWPAQNKKDKKAWAFILPLIYGI